MAKARLVRRTNPSGTMAASPATDPWTASTRESELVSCELMSSTAIGTSSHCTICRIRSIPSRSSERTRENWRASSASRDA